MANPAEAIIGGLLIEMFFAFILYGITTLQTFIYFQKYPGDRFSLKALVATVWILETVHTAFCMEFIYAYLIEGFGNYDGFLDVNWYALFFFYAVDPPSRCGRPSLELYLRSLRMWRCRGIGVTVVASSGIALCVQGYYTWRVWVVSGNSVIWTIVIGTFALLRVGEPPKHRENATMLTALIAVSQAFGIASAVLSYEYPNWETFRSTKKSLVTISGGLGSAALVDMLVALTLTFYLKRGRHTWHKESNSMVNRILLYAVNTGAITGTASLLCVLLFAVKKSSLVFLGLVMVQGKLYANSLLGSLNARSHIRSKGSLPAYSSSSGSSAFRVTSPRPSHIRPVEVFQHTVVQDDSIDTMDSMGGFDLKNMKEEELA
ncbi:hypothetical protein ONZ51_g6029 [Trametes cubensis]|uniref:DUF6534 domain-containing protein n=1 Tax=Trametes cubensis TaxID=1111947 RepID=A0AAD7TSU8_9APHY|nr:hypothetical protein ONZ51_g6029 [Trametes cubensis]